MKKVLLIILLFPMICISQIKGKVINIKDGDTIVVLDSLFKQQTIRIADIDCPENKQPFGTRAKQFTANEVLGKIVMVKIKNTDRYGRTVGYVMYNNKNLSLELLKNGLAWHYKYYSKDKEMADLEDFAKKNKLGLWSHKKPINPYNWRKGVRK